MIFTAAPIGGAFIIDIEPRKDDRGFFARTFDAAELAQRGLEGHVAQASISYNGKRGTLRGMHYQIAPHEEAKLVRCTGGRILDVIADTRNGSPTRGEWFAVELSAENHRMLYIPPGVAHGFQTLTDCTEVLYQMSESYHPESARGFRWNDPAFGIEWPLAHPTMSETDRFREPWKG